MLLHKKTLFNTHPVIVNTADKGKYRPTKKYMESESNSLLNLSSTHPENRWRLMKYLTLKNY